MKENETVKSISQEERPYEKCKRFGADNLTDAELLAIILRTGTKGQNVLDLARNILHAKSGCEGLLNVHQLSVEDLQRMHGIGPVKALQIRCLSELTKRLAKASGIRNLNFSNPKSIADYYMEDMRHLKQERMKLLMFNTKTRLLGETDISKGTVNASLVSPRELFIEALQKNAVTIILLHNHPSGDPAPSKEDLLITKRVRDAGALIGIHLLDHIIIGDNCYTSFIEEGFMGS
jgi:DNA repair protein radc